MSNLHDKTKIYPTNKDIYGESKGEKTMKKVTIEEIQEEIRRIEARIKPDESKMNEIYDKVNKKAAEFTIAVGEGDTEKIEKAAKELEELHKQESMQKSLNWASEHGQIQTAIKNNSKIKEMTKQFENESLKELDKLAEDKQKAIQTFKETREAFLRATYELGSFNYKMGKKCEALEGIRKYLENPIIGDMAYATKYPHTTYNQVDVADKHKRYWVAGCKNMDYKSTLEVVGE